MEQENTELVTYVAEIIDNCLVNCSHGIECDKVSCPLGSFLDDYSLHSNEYGDDFANEVIAQSNEWLMHSILAVMAEKDGGEA